MAISFPEPFLASVKNSSLSSWNGLLQRSLWYNFRMKYVLSFLLLSTVLFGAGCFTHADADQFGKVRNAAGEAVILINETGFVPQTLTIRKGDPIRFLNEGREEHKPIFDANPELTSSEPLATLDSWSLTLKNRGEWAYHDELNPDFKGLIIVK